MLTPYRALLGAYFALAAVVVLWNIAAANRILKGRRGSRLMVAATAFGALMLIPGLLVAVSAASLVYGRAIQPVAWLWPAVTVLFLLQAAIALLRGRVNPVLGVPIFIYDLVIAVVAVTRYMSSRGFAPPTSALILSAAQSNALGLVGGSAVLTSAAWLLVPMFSPALPSRARWRVVVRTALAAGVTIATAMVLIELPAAAEAISSYGRFSRDVLTERPQGDFEFGLKVFPDLTSTPPPIAISTDLQLADSLGIDAISIVVTPEGARGRALDSLSHVVDNIRDDSTTLIVTLSYPSDAHAQLARNAAAYTEARLADVNRLTRALRPNIFIPALEPYGAGARALGTQPPEFWIRYITRAASIAHYVNPNIKVGIAASSYGVRDSTLYAWAASRTSPVDIPGFSLLPGFDGATSLDTHMRIAQRWLRATPRPKPHWVWSAGGYPIAHGEASQRLALHGAISWATAQPAIIGLVVTQASDYETERGLRGPTGHARPAMAELVRAIALEREAATTQ